MKERYWTMELEECNEKDLIKSIEEKNLTAIVDEKDGGIIAYVLNPFVKEVMKKLK